MTEEYKPLLDLIRKHFKDEMQAKTGWGRNEVLQRYDLAVAHGERDYAKEVQHERQ